MAIVPMTDATPLEVASAAEYNNVTANIRDLDSRLGPVVSDNTAAAQLVALTSRATTLEERVAELEAAAGISVQFIRKPELQTSINATLQNDTHFAFELVAGGVYTQEGYLIYDGASDGPAPGGQGGLKLQFSGPSGSMMWTNFGVNPGNLTSYNVVPETLNSSVPRSVGTNGSTPMTLMPTGILVVGATGGTLRLRWAQNQVNVTPTRILANSWMRLTKVA